MLGVCIPTRTGRRSARTQGPFSTGQLAAISSFFDGGRCAEACRHEITRIIREGYLRASWSIESRARLVFFSTLCPRQDRTNRPEWNEKVFHVDI